MFFSTNASLPAGEILETPKSGDDFAKDDVGKPVNPDGLKELFLSTLARSPCSMNSKRSHGESASVVVTINHDVHVPQMQSKK